MSALLEFAGVSPERDSRRPRLDPDTRDALSALLRVLLRNTGADCAMVLREQQRNITIEALARPGKVEFPECPIEARHDIALSAVRHVNQTREMLLLMGSAVNDARVASDPFIHREAITSIFCTPILYKDKSLGLLYMHSRNPIPGDAYWPAEEEPSPLAVILENARLRSLLEDSEQFLQSWMDALPAHIAVLDLDGSVVAVNGSWRHFADDNGFNGGHYGVGMNYLAVCDAAASELTSAREVAAGLRAVIRHQRDDFFFEYCCEDAGKRRWFQMRVKRFNDRGTERLLVVHHQIDEVKQAQEELRSALDEVARLKDRLEAENIYLQQEIECAYDFDEIVGDSASIRRVFHQIEQVAETNATVMVLGETGTGKELIARAIHMRSPRRNHPLVKINCAALPSALIESELFGHEKGAFTGALNKRIGRFEVADGGTIFLDEIGDLPPDLQAKLLRVLQEGEFERLGSSATIKTNVRVIAATNQDLEKAISEGKFRSDLFYRLNVFPIFVPPLRERRGDIPLLVRYFTAKKQVRLGKTVKTVPKAVMDSLMNYSWPGNIRELENVIERAVIQSPGSVLNLEDVFSAGDNAAPGHPDSSRLEDLERSHIVKVMEGCGWKIKGGGNAAERLGMNPSTLRYRLKKLRIERPQVSAK